MVEPPLPIRKKLQSAEYIPAVDPIVGGVSLFKHSGLLAMWQKGRLMSKLRFEFFQRRHVAQIYARSRIQKFFDNMLFPIRALFVPEEKRFCLTSLRDERFEMVWKFSSGRVLDIGCGRNNLFVKNWTTHPESIGLDVFSYEGVERVHRDMTKLPFPDNLFDTVTLIAVGGHIPQKIRVNEFAEIARVLKVDGKLLMTEGEKITQTIDHLWRHYSYAVIGQKDMDTERGMEEDEQYCMPSDEIVTYLNTPPLKFVDRVKFMWGLNNLYIAQKQAGAKSHK